MPLVHKTIKEDEQTWMFYLGLNFGKPECSYGMCIGAKAVDNYGSNLIDVYCCRQTA